MSAGQDELLLKWGTIKGWDLKSEAAKSAIKAYADIGEHSPSAMRQRDTPEQKQALCGLIDAIDGTITNDWSGETMTAEQAKSYVLGYGRSGQ